MKQSINEQRYEIITFKNNYISTYNKRKFNLFCRNISPNDLERIFKQLKKIGMMIKNKSKITGFYWKK